MRLGRIIGAAALAFGIGQAASAQQAATNGTTFEDWVLVCEAAAVNQTICAITQRLSISESNAFLAEVRLQKLNTNEGPRILLALTTPTNMVLPVRPGYRIGEGEEALPLDWRTCTPQFCTASRIVDEAELDQIKRAVRMIVGYQPVGSNEPVAFPVSLKGVTAGLNALDG